MEDKKIMEEKKKGKIIIFAILVAFLFLVAYLFWAGANTDAGNYDYCVEWEGLNEGTLHRDSLLYTCYSLAQGIFYCDYEIQDDESLIVKPILNTTYNEDGGIIGIDYGESNHFNCTKWLKSKRLK